MKDHFQTFAAYNRWANGLLYDAVARLPESALWEDKGAFFGSVMGTLNHILVGDYLWMGRIDRLGPKPSGLDDILYRDFHALREAREQADDRLIGIVDELNGDELDRDLVYQSVSRGSQRRMLRHVFSHIFNHQTHHRGQVHTLISQSGMEPPEIDLIYFLAEKDA